MEAVHQEVLPFQEQEEGAAVHQQLQVDMVAEVALQGHIQEEEVVEEDHRDLMVRVGEEEALLVCIQELVEAAEGHLRHNQVVEEGLQGYILEGEGVEEDLRRSGMELEVPVEGEEVVLGYWKF